MTLLQSVDPGLDKGCAAATFEHGELKKVARGLTPERTWPKTPSFITFETVVELPDRVTVTTADAILKLRDVANKCVAPWVVFNPSMGKLVEVNTWKSNVPKAAHQRLIFNALTPSEREVIANVLKITVDNLAEKLNLRAARNTQGQHAAGDIVDAVGLGLYTLGRINNRGMMIAR